MPLLLLIPLIGGGWWVANRELAKTEDLLIKGAVAGLVIYIAYANRGALAKLVRA